MLHLLHSFVFQKGIASAAERIELDPTQQLDTRTVAGAKIQFTSDPVLHSDVAACRCSSGRKTTELFFGGFILLNGTVLV